MNPVNITVQKPIIFLPNRSIISNTILFQTSFIPCFSFHSQLHLRAKRNVICHRDEENRNTTNLTVGTDPGNRVIATVHCMNPNSRWIASNRVGSVAKDGVSGADVIISVGTRRWNAGAMSPRLGIERSIRCSLKRGLHG